MVWRQIRNYFLPETFETVNSSYAGEIKVVKWHNKISVWAGGFEQSGPIVGKIFKGLQGKRYRNVLILGLGCGTILKYLTAEKITGVEIDPVMIAIGKKYFNLENVKIIIGDATKIKFDEKFDLIVVDLYKNGSIIDFVPNQKWLTDDGLIIFNQLTFNKQELPNLTGYKIIKETKTEYNKLIICRKLL